MNTNKMKHINLSNAARKTFVAAIFAMSIASLDVNAQVKVGATPNKIVSGAKFQIDGDDQTTTATTLIVDGSGNVGIGTATPTDKLEIKGTADKSGLKFSNMNNTTAPTAGAAPLGVDGNGNVVVVTPATPDAGSLLPGQSAYYYTTIPTSTANNTILSSLKSDLLKFEGIRVDLMKGSTSVYYPRFYNTTAAPVTVHFATASVTPNYSSANVDIAPAGFANTDGDAVVYWGTNNAETEVTDIIIGARWYRVLWFCYTGETDNTIYIRNSVTRLQ